MHALDFLAWAGAGISLWGTARYGAGILKNRTQPRLASWIAWGAANGVLMAVALMNHDLTAAAFDGLAALGNFGILALAAAKRAGERPSGATDWACLASAGICLATILTLHTLTYLDAALAMSANVIATWPTIQHAWFKPKEETWQLFGANAGANTLGLISVIGASGMSLANIAGPLISMLGNVSLVSITVGRGWVTRLGREVQQDFIEVEQEVEDAVSGLQTSAEQASD
jgi:hypothetical protein